MNLELIQNFEILRDYYKAEGDIWRTKAYSDTVLILNNFKIKITNINQVKNIRGIGKNIQGKIKEFLDTGKIEKVEEIKLLNKSQDKSKLNSKDIYKEKIIKLFTGIYGVGEQNAFYFYKLGMRTLDDLKFNEDQILNRSQKIGLKYYNEFNKKIPRRNITIFQIVVRLLLNMAFGKNSYKLEVSGSYRRGEKFSGDIDMLITSKVFKLIDMVNLLKRYNLITDILSMKQIKFMGVGNMIHCKLETRSFRFDIEFLPETEWITGLLYFTGSKNFNIMMRNRAKKLGYILNEHGLINSSTGKKIQLRDEKELFKILNTEYFHPTKR
jgi:DNA polymerase/3'-5' exonuclease PolX